MSLIDATFLAALCDGCVVADIVHANLRPLELDERERVGRKEGDRAHHVARNDAERNDAIDFIEKNGVETADEIEISGYDALGGLELENGEGIQELLEHPRCVVNAVHPGVESAGGADETGSGEERDGAVLHPPLSAHLGEQVAGARYGEVDRGIALVGSAGDGDGVNGAAQDELFLGLVQRIADDARGELAAGIDEAGETVVSRHVRLVGGGEGVSKMLRRVEKEGVSLLMRSSSKKES